MSRIIFWVIFLRLFGYVLPTGTIYTSPDSESAVTKVLNKSEIANESSTAQSAYLEAIAKVNIISNKRLRLSPNESSQIQDLLSKGHKVLLKAQEKVETIYDQQQSQTTTPLAKDANAILSSAQLEATKEFKKISSYLQQAIVDSMEYRRKAVSKKKINAPGHKTYNNLSMQRKFNIIGLHSGQKVENNSKAITWVSVILPAILLIIFVSL